MVDDPPHVYHDILSSDAHNYNMCSSSSSPAPDLERPLPPTCAADPLPHMSPVSGKAILHDMFLSRRVAGIRASVFHASEKHLRKVCLLHGLHVSESTKMRDIKIRVLYHIMNGDCFSQRCQSSRPAPDCSACLCVAGGCPSSLSITSFVADLLKASTPSQITTEDLLLVVESTGNQEPYKNRLYLRRRVLTSLQAFVSRCRQRVQRDLTDATSDPFGDLFMGFEGKRRPVLESIMNHHGLLVGQQPKLSSEHMWNALVSHIASGHCAHQPRPRIQPRLPTDPYPEANNATDTAQVCNDFVRDADLEPEDEVGNEIKVLNKVLHKNPSRNLLLRFLRCKSIPHDSSHSRKRLQLTLARFVRVLEKRRVGHSQPSMSSSDAWPSVVSPTLKGKIAENFRREISRDRLRSFVCCSCSSSIFTEHSVTVKRSELELSCLQHPEMRFSGMPPDLRHIKNANLDPDSLQEGLLLDRRGMKNAALTFCKDCSTNIQKGKTPPLSLANNLLLGDVPAELHDLTIVEESVIARCRAKVCIIQLKAEDTDIVLPNTQRGMRGHVVIYPQKPDTLLSVLPPRMEDACTPICVVFVGSKRPSQEWLRRHARPLIVRRERIRAALLWLKAHSALYRDIVLDEQSLNAFPANDILPVHIELMSDANTADILTSRYDVSSPSTEHNSKVDASQTIFDSVVVTDLTSDATINQMRAAAMKHMKMKGGGFVQIPHDDTPANEPLKTCSALHHFLLNAKLSISSLWRTHDFKNTILFCLPCLIFFNAVQFSCKQA